MRHFPDEYEVSKLSESALHARTDDCISNLASRLIEHQFNCAVSENISTAKKAFPRLIRQALQKIRSEAAGSAYDARLYRDELRRKEISAQPLPKKVRITGRVSIHIVIMQLRISVRAGVMSFGSGQQTIIVAQ